MGLAVAGCGIAACDSKPTPAPSAKTAEPAAEPVKPAADSAGTTPNHTEAMPNVADELLATEEDFEEAATRTINKDNWREQLDQLEREIK